MTFQLNNRIGLCDKINLCACPPDVSLERSEIMVISYTIGSIAFVGEPEYFKDGRYIKGKVTFIEILRIWLFCLVVLNNMHYNNHRNEH